jgi:hypothetical protein
MRIGDKSEPRGWIIAGAAIIAGIAATAATVAIKHGSGADDPNRDPHGYKIILLPIFAGYAAAALSLPFTLTLTSDLGSVEE